MLDIPKGPVADGRELHSFWEKVGKLDGASIEEVVSQFNAAYRGGELTLIWEGPPNHATYTVDGVVAETDGSIVYDLRSVEHDSGPMRLPVSRYPTKVYDPTLSLKKKPEFPS